MNLKNEISRKAEMSSMVHLSDRGGASAYYGGPSSFDID